MFLSSTMQNGFVFIFRNPIFFFLLNHVKSKSDWYTVIILAIFGLGIPLKTAPFVCIEIWFDFDKECCFSILQALLAISSICQGLRCPRSEIFLLGSVQGILLILSLRVRRSPRMMLMMSTTFEMLLSQVQLPLISLNFWSVKTVYIFLAVIVIWVF